MKSGIQHFPFTAKQGVFPRMIVSPIQVLDPNSTKPGDVTKLSLIAQWDTGADHCFISPNLIHALRLKSVYEVSVNTTESEDSKRNAYLIDLVLPNNIYFNEVLAIEDKGLSGIGIDCIIGLSIINEIDFALTHNKNRETILSISYPADRLVDFEN